MRLIEERDPDAPFLLHVALGAPHAPLRAPEDAIAEYVHVDDGAPVPCGPVVLSHYGRGVVQHAYFRDDWKLVRAADGQGGTEDLLFDIRNDPYEQHDLAAAHPDVFSQLVEELEAIPKVEPVSLNARLPDMNAPGAPSAWEPDNRPPGGTPYAESGPVPFPEGNYP